MYLASHMSRLRQIFTRVGAFVLFVVVCKGSGHSRSRKSFAGGWVEGKEQCGRDQY